MCAQATHNSGNTILGAKPLKADGSSFYYSDYNNRFANKGYHRDKWPCCSGSFPQITADYGISSYFHDSDGVYVNLYTPSRVSWKRDSARIALTQRTSYPHDLSTQIEITADKPAGFAVHLRIPGWAGPKSTVAVNGQRVSLDLVPGSFARVDRTWQNEDRIEVEFEAATTLEAVDPQHPDVVAPVNGPLALFAVGEILGRLRQADLLAASRISSGSSTWRARSEARIITLKPFASIQEEGYRLYHQIES
jgi:DUF1680 family protein